MSSVLVGFRRKELIRCSILDCNNELVGDFTNN